MINIDEISAGLSRGEFFLEYMPTVNLADGRCVGAEALVRWRRSTGVVPPNEFIPLIEEHPLAGLLTYWVIETIASEIAPGCADMRKPTSASTFRPRFWDAVGWNMPW